MIKVVVLFSALALVAAPLARPLGQSQTAAPTGQSQATAPQTSGKPPIQAKNQAEYQAYQAAVANAQNPDAMEKAADDFATKFPESDLRVLLYRAAMNSYQTSGNSQKMMDMGLKVLGIDKDDPEALIGVSEVLQEHTSPTDLDAAQRAKQAISLSQHALETVDTDLNVPAGSPPDKIETYKKYLRATALATIGTVQYKQEQYADAEVNLRKSIDADTGNPDAVIILRLALALDQQKKYADALQQANRAVELTQETAEVGKLARNERDRLVIETGGSAGPAATTHPQTPGPQTSQPQTSAPTTPAPKSN
jgi:tetratricopeptide (TPR) repeat protein